MTTTARTALVLGATGGIGGAVARRLAAGGWRVKALARGVPAAEDGLEWLRGDAMDGAAVARAAAGVGLVVHAVNPPGYRRWGELVLPMLDNSIAAARAAGARILLPGTVYNFGPDAGDAPTETAPQHPQTVKGRIRVEMERRLEAAAGAGLPTIIVRAGDFFGPRAGNNWFSQALVKPGRRPMSITLPGRPGVGHQWAYLPDVAETMVRLADRAASLPDFARFHMSGHWDSDGLRFAEAIWAALGAPKLPLRRLPWGLMRLASPFVPLFRELGEMCSLWERPLMMGNAALVAALGAEPHTPLDRAVAATLAAMGCIDAAAPPAVGITVGGR